MMQPFFSQPLTLTLSPQAGRGSALANRFILVSNLEASDGGAAIVAGNERVVAARLSMQNFSGKAISRSSLKTV